MGRPLLPRNPLFTSIKWLALIVILFGELLTHTWIRTESTQTILSITDRQQQLAKLLSYQRELTVERDLLKSDSRIVRIARDQLGMTSDVFNQTIYFEKGRL